MGQDLQGPHCELGVPVQGGPDRFILDPPSDRTVVVGQIPQRIDVGGLLARIGDGIVTAQTACWRFGCAVAVEYDENQLCGLPVPT